eukprot:Skav220606  [mRNA]  locus=scaffold507:109682:112741:+ [translate_table: standard]
MRLAGPTERDPFDIEVAQGWVEPQHRCIRPVTKRRREGGKWSSRCNVTGCKRPASGLVKADLLGSGGPRCFAHGARRCSAMSCAHDEQAEGLERIAGRGQMLV